MGAARGPCVEVREDASNGGPWAITAVAGASSASEAKESAATERWQGLPEGERDRLIVEYCDRRMLREWLSYIP